MFNLFANLCLSFAKFGTLTTKENITMRIEKSFTIYQDKEFFSAFPGLANLGNGHLAVAFRRAPNYQTLPGIPGDFVAHGDALSQLMYMESFDNGETWGQPRLLASPPLGAAQDGGLLYDGKYLFANSFIWRVIPDIVKDQLSDECNNEFFEHHLSWLVPYGSFVMRSDDGGQHWGDIVLPEALPGNIEVLPGQPRRLHNRSNLVRTPDGRLLLGGQALRYKPRYRSSIVLYSSCDNGESFQYLTTPVDDAGEGVYEEPWIYITPGGRWVILIRCHRTVDKEESAPRARLAYVYSDDQGMTWSKPVHTDIHAEPCACCRMDDEKVLLVYGYRQSDGCGVRGRICSAEFDDIVTAEEFIIRDDGGWWDVGYPSVAPLGNNRYMVAYYMDKPEYRGASALEASILTL